MSDIQYPAAFIAHMQAQLGTEFDAFIETLNGSSPTSVRINPYKLIDKFDSEEEVPWCANGRYLQERPSFTFDPLFHAGTYYVQEASSMYIEQAWKLVNPDNKTVRVLDMCAAPGGKSTHIAALMNSESLLVSNEIVPNRNKILQENITKWGTANVVITQNKPADFARLANFFDIILIDAPCSGEGLFRKDKDAVNEWSEENVTMCGVRQQEILQRAYTCLKPGGHIIYSTCTYEHVENDANIEYAERLGMQRMQLPLVVEGIKDTGTGLQFYPHRIKGEGFYISVLQKNTEANFDEAYMNPKAMGEHTRHAEILAKYLEQPELFSAVEKGEMLIAMPKQIQRSTQIVSAALNVRHAGILLGSFKGKDFLPSHDVAINIHASKSLPSVDVTHEQAIIFLRSEPIKADTDTLGWCIVKHQGHNLGWIKVLSARSNNYYPKEWRILKR